MWCEQMTFITCHSLIFIVFDEINRIEERLITVLKKLHMDVKERHSANLLAKSKYGSQKMVCFALLPDDPATSPG